MDLFYGFIFSRNNLLQNPSVFFSVFSVPFLPADGRLTVRRPLGGAQSLPHLSLRQAQGQAADLECFGEFSDLLQVDPVHLAGGRLGVWENTNTNTNTNTPRFIQTSFTRVNGAKILT